MNCPTCPDSTLIMTDRSGIEIDYCPTCRGVWLDRGELDKIIERDASPPARQPDRTDDARSDRGRDVRDRDDRDRDDRGRRDEARHDRGRYDDDDRDDDDHRYAAGGRRKRKRESLLGELFDF
ncbi:MAG: zf-TFIIB domain-containing protein [Ilumatobacter sp.]|uniref:TFIIB-type zinc ribbon-containing protein n=1 Tax=Ilumatobacter sp. TaxID=1967498 RepID=UPI003297CEF6